MAPQGRRLLADLLDGGGSSWSTFTASLFFTPVAVQVQILHRDPFFPLHT